MSHLIFGAVIGFVIGFFGGWVQAHQTVATECKKLGSFYVGNTVFDCKPRLVDQSDLQFHPQHNNEKGSEHG